MLKKVTEESEITYILDRIREEDKCELKALYGENWYADVLEILREKDFLVLYGEDENKKSVPIAMGGICDVSGGASEIACVWMLSSYYIERNKALLWKELKKCVISATKEYDILYNFIYKSNKKAKKWLKMLNFKFDNPSPKGLNVKEGFEFFYYKRER